MNTTPLNKWMLALQRVFENHAMLVVAMLVLCGILGPRALAQQSGQSVELGVEGVFEGTPISYEAGLFAGAEGGVDGTSASVRAGLAAHIEASLGRVQVGDDQFGASTDLQARVDVLIGMEGRAGMWFDDNGITFGAEARAGAYISARADLTFEARVFGVGVQVTAWGEAHAGLMAQGRASVTIGYNGMIEFQLGAGAAIGIGGSVGLSFGVDAPSLMAALGLDDYEELLEWIDALIDEPEELVGTLLLEAAGATVLQTAEAAWRAGEDFVNDVADGLGNIANQAGDFFGGLTDGAGDFFGDLLGGRPPSDHMPPLPTVPPGDDDIRILPIPERARPGQPTQPYQRARSLDRYSH